MSSVKTGSVATFKTLRVLISYRMDAGDSIPRWRALRAQIKQHCLLGTDLTRQGILSVDEIISESLLKIADAATVVEFEIDPKVRFSDHKIRRYLNGHFVGFVEESNESQNVATA